MSSNARKKRNARDMEEEEQQGNGDNHPRKRRRFVWTDNLHKRFVAAIFDHGLKSVTPKLLLELMKKSADDPLLEKSLTREEERGTSRGIPAELTSDHIKSHLQKFRANSLQSRKEFLYDFERASAEAQLAAEHEARKGSKVFPPTYSTYPVSMSRPYQQKEYPSGADQRLPKERQSYFVGEDDAASGNEPGKRSPIANVRGQTTVPNHWNLPPGAVQGHTPGGSLPHSVHSGGFHDFPGAIPPQPVTWETSQPPVTDWSMYYHNPPPPEPPRYFHQQPQPSPQNGPGGNNNAYAAIPGPHVSGNMQEPYVGHQRPQGANRNTLSDKGSLDGSEAGSKSQQEQANDEVPTQLVDHLQRHLTRGGDKIQQGTATPVTYPQNQTQNGEPMKAVMQQMQSAIEMHRHMTYAKKVYHDKYGGYREHEHVNPHQDTYGENASADRASWESASLTLPQGYRPEQPQLAPSAVGNIRPGEWGGDTGFTLEGSRSDGRESVDGGSECRSSDSIFGGDLFKSHTNMAPPNSAEQSESVFGFLEGS